MPSIKSQSVVIIGGSSGIGAGAATLACQEGARVAIASSNAGRVEAAVKKISDAVPGAHIAGYTVDISGYDVEECLERLFTQVTEANGGRLDHIILTAGSNDVRPVSEYTAEYFKNGAPLRFIAPVVIAKLAPRFLKPHWTSSVIFTGGVVGEKPVRGYGAGAGWAAGLYGTVRGLALEMAPVRVNGVSPGATETDMWGPAGDGARDGIIAAVAARSLLGKVGQPAEVGEAYVYLMRDTNSTGSVVSTNGGALLV